MSISFDPSIFMNLGINPEANSMDNPKPPLDGTYQILLKAAPVPATKKVDGKEVANSKLCAGTDYVGQVVVPQGDAASYKLDDQSRVNYTLFLEADVLSPDTGKRIRTLPTYVTSNIGRNGASVMVDLARVIVETHGPVIDLAGALSKYNTPSSVPNMVWKGLAEAIAELLEGNPDGIQIPAYVSTNLEKATGKKDAKGYDETAVVAYGSDKIQKKFPDYWTGDKLEEGFRLVTQVKGFKS
jgi:hypothetical protein